MTYLVHVSSSESREIHAFLLAPETGRLTLLEVVDVPGSGAPTRGNLPLTWSRDGTVLYAHIRIEPFPLTAFALDAESATLRVIETVSMPAPMAYLSPSLNGKALLGASYDSALLSVNRIASDGRVTVPSEQTLATPPKAHCVMEAPFGGFVYATSVDGEVILRYRWDAASGHLDAASMQATPTRPGSGPRHLAFHPLFDRLYCVNEEAGSLTAYRVDRVTGELQEIQHVSLVPPDFSGRALGADLHITPDGRFVYASVRKTHSISAFHVNVETGTLIPAGTFNVEAYPRGFAIAPDGRFLLCAGQQSHHVAVLSIDQVTGALTPVGRYAVGKRPSWIEIVPAPAAMRPAKPLHELG